MSVILQKMLPKHFLSWFLGLFARCRCSFFKKWAIWCFIRYFKVDMEESAITNIEQFSSFNDFFIRHLKPGIRDIATDPAAVISPADGVVMEFGKITATRLLQAKGNDYQLNELLGGDHLLTQRFSNGAFFTVYLAPKNYHRVHMPISGRLMQMTYVPGDLFSVSPSSVRRIRRLFAGNERVICVFETEAGPMTVIFIGALLIGSVVTPWHGRVMPAKKSKRFIKIYSDQQIEFKRGEEIGYFQWGSTVIVLFGPQKVQWEALHLNDTIKMGQMIGKVMTPS